ncbi:MAG TPA: RNA polymerase sigma factor [Rhizomicrobium sp.]|nr:RNA polymerase sigma factor [Rhizomicrobium sp.]
MKAGDADTDEEFAACAKTGDRAAFDVLVRRHKDGLYRFVRRYVGDADEAYDVLQDSFVAAWSGLRRYDPSRPFLPWLRVIALNKCRDFGRRQTVRRLFLLAFARENAQASIRPRTDGETDAAQLQANRLARLDRAIAQLPKFYKEPLLLTSVSGLSHQDAAAMLKTTPKAIEMRLYRARRKIQEIMDDGAEG